MSQKAWIHNSDQYPDPLLPKVLNPNPYMVYTDPQQHKAIVNFNSARRSYYFQTKCAILSRPKTMSLGLFAMEETMKEHWRH